MLLVLFWISGSGYFVCHTGWAMKSRDIYLQLEIRENMRLYNIPCVIFRVSMVK